MIKKIALSTILLAVLLSMLPFTTQMRTQAETSAPMVLATCSGEDPEDSLVMGEIKVYGRWTLQNNNTWSYYESYSLTGTNPNWTYKGYLLTRYESKFYYNVEEYDPTGALFMTYHFEINMVCTF